MYETIVLLSCCLLTQNICKVSNKVVQIVPGQTFSKCFFCPGHITHWFNVISSGHMLHWSPFSWFLYLTDLGKARGFCTNTSVIHSLIHWFIYPLFKISLRRRQDQMVKNVGCSHKTNYIDTCSEILNPEGEKNYCSIQQGRPDCPWSNLL